MRKITLALFGLFLFSLLATSCNKDEAEPQFELIDIIGVWEQIGGDDFVACPNGDNRIFEISETKIRDYGADENGCSSSFFSTVVEFKFVNGNTLQVDGYTYKVTSLNGDRMTLVQDFFGTTIFELERQ